MKRRLLAFLMAFVMMLSLVPPAAFAADAGEEPHFTKIVTRSGEALTASYVKTVNGEAAWGEKIDTPYYHVTVPEGTEEVLLTYPKDTAFVSYGSDESNAPFFYMNTYPGQSGIDYGGTLPVTVNEDGSKTVTVPVESFLVDSEGAGTAVGMAYMVDADNKSALDFIAFTYAEPAPVTHTVTLTSGEGYTLAGEATVEDGADYTFTLSVAEGYEKTDAFAVMANGETLTANGDGSYTAAQVYEDLTVTVEGVARKQAAAHTVTLKTGTGYTLTGEATAEDGKDYTFTLTVTDGYGKSDSFAVKANGEALTANSDGSYTVRNVTSDLTISVVGVTKLHTITLPKSRSKYTITDYTTGEELGTEIEVAEGQKYQFKITPNDGYAVRDKDFNINFDSIYNKMDIEENDDYAIVTVSKIVEDDKMSTVTGVKKIIKVTAAEGEGYTIVPDENMRQPLLKGEDYSFKVVISDGYAKSDDFAVTGVYSKYNYVRDLVEKNGVYTIAAIQEDHTIHVDGVVKTAPGMPFTSILTKDDQEVTVDYVATVPFTLNGVTYADAPYYHVTVPAKTRSVYVTYPADVEFDADGVAFTYALTIPDYTAKVGLVGYSVNTNSDGSKLVCIDVEDFLLDDNGAGKAVSLKYSGSQDPVNFFSFSYDPQTVVTHSVKLTAGEGYTLEGETTVQDGDDYTFTITIADGYEKTDSFAVKVNGNAVQPNANGNCTVKSVSADLTVTVEGVVKKQEASTKRFTAIVTDDGKEVSAEFKGMIPVETYQTFNDGPYYHVTVPAGTKSVQVTYPASVNIAGGSAAYFYTLSVPDYTVGFGEGTLDVTTNSDGSKTMTIPVAPYLLDASGKGTAASAEYSGSFDPITFFSFAYEGGAAVSYNVTLTAGDGYTLTGEATVEEGSDYSFTIAIADGYEKTDDFAVKANGEALTDNSDGRYTVESVSADLTITVEGVAKKQTTPEVPFTAIVTDNDEELTAEYVETVAAESAQDGTITAPYYHVVVPEGTEYVKVTYPESAALYQPIEGNVYWCGLTLPGHISGRGQSFPADPNEDGSVTAIIYVSNFVLNEDGTGAAVGVVSTDDSGNFTTPNFFSFSYAAKPVTTHTVTLTAGTGYTLTGEATVEEGSDYSFTIAIADGYEKTDDFAVKANGEALTANSDGSYTVKSVSADLTITVEGVAKKQTVPFSGILTDSGKKVTVEYQGMVPAKNNYSTYDDTPYYHVTVPAGTTSVQVTYPASVDMMGTNTAYGYTLTIPDHVLDWTSSGFDFTTNDDGSKTVTIPIADYLLDASGKGTAVSVEYNNYNPISFFTFAYEPAVTHKVDLSSGSGYTLTGADTVEDGADYTFRLEILDGYGKGDSFEVRANSTTLTANEDGTYTVKNVTSDLRISVRGVYGAYTVYLPESRDGYTLTDFVTGEELPSSFKLAMTKKYEIKVTLKDGYAVRGNDYGVDFTVGMVARTDTYDGYAVITIQTVTGDGRIAIKGVKQLVNITLPEGEGYTVAPTKSTSNPVLSGDYYYFTVTIADGYEKTDAFAVKANGETLTANQSGNYTAKDFGADLTITVEGVAKKQTTPEVPFTAIVTDNDEELIAEYVETVAAESAQDGTITAPYYHVVVPEGTEYVKVTYPESAAIYQPIEGSVYWCGLTLPGHTSGRGQSFPADPNEDGSVTAIIYVSNFVLNEDGTGAAVGVVSTDDSGNFTTPNFFSFSYAAKPVTAYTVTLTAGDGYTLTGEATAEEGKDYTFTLTVAEDYYKGGAFAVKADGKALTANEDGTYTVSNVTADVTITVEGVVKKPENGLSELSFAGSSSSSAERFQMTPAFDPAVKEYTILVPDSVTSLNVWATRDDDLSSKTVIKAQWTNQMSATGDVKDTTVTSGNASGRSMSGAAIAGDKGNTITLTVTDGDYSDTYTVTVVRTDPTLQKLGLGTVKLDKSFTSAQKEYTATTADESVTVTAEPRSSSYTVTINGKDDKTVPLEMGENVITIEVQNTRGDKNTYTVTVTRVAAVMVTLDVTPADAKLTLTDSKGTVMTPDGTGAYRLMAGSTYYYTATAGGYKRTTGSFTVTESGPVSIALEKDTSKPVTVYFSFSHDDKFEFCAESGTTMALKKVTVPYFDLANYGMEDFYFKSEDYGAVDPDHPGQGSDLEPGTAEYAYGKITMLHLFIYATEVYYCGIDPADAGQGYLLDKGLLGTDLFTYSGSTGSIFLNTIWNYDLNLNYYLNHEYPLASAGWGSTCDQILLHDDDVVTLGHFTDWNFFGDSTSVFNHFEADNDSPNQGDQITLSVIRDGADMYGTYNTAHTPVTYCPDIYYAPADEIYDGDVTTWTHLGKADEEGHLTVDTSDLAPGEYIFAMAGQPGAENPDAICSTPGGMRITVRERDAQRKGDINGDGTIDVLDVTALFNAISGEETLDTFVADVNRDGVVDMFDVIALYDSIRGE